MPNAQDLRDALGLNDLGGATRPRQETGGSALQRDLQQAFEEGRGSNALSPTRPTGQTSYSVPWSISPISMPEQGEQTSAPIRVSPTFVAAPEMPSMPPAGISGSTGSSSMVAPISAASVSDQLLPTYNSSDAANDEYEDWFEENGNDTGRDVARTDGSQILEDLVTGASLANPMAGVAMNNLRNNPIANGLVDSTNRVLEDTGLRDDVDEVLGRLGGIADFFGTDAVDNGRNPDKASAAWATGDAMQNYGEMGMGGRDWWKYDPYSVYNKADEQQDFGFRPYLPDQQSRLNMGISQLLDAPSDLFGALSKGREELPDLLSLTNPMLGMAVRNLWGGNNGHYVMNVDGKIIDGQEWDSMATPYVNNMRRILDYSPEDVMRRPENGKLHGTPVSTMVMEYAIPNTDGGVSYVHGEYDNSYYNDDRSMHVDFTDGQGVDIPESVWSGWVQPDDSVIIPFQDMTSYVRAEDARGFLPDDLDALNDRAIEEKDYANAPVLYMPDMEMDDGTRLTWDQVQRAYIDRADGSDPGISYDFGPLGLARPQRLSQDLVDENGNVNLGSIPNNAIDFTLGSLPIMINEIAYPASISQALGKSMAGIDPGKYDPWTGSDQYISADLDESGRIVPTYTPLQHASNIVGTAMTPKFEELAGPLSGHSAVEELLGTSLSPSLRRLLGTFLIDTFGEGAEELVGNVVDEISDQADAAYGDVTDPNGERLLDDQGEPVRDENGDYRFVNALGEPMTEWVDETGHVYKDPNTPLDRRLSNAIDWYDALNTIAGGMEVAGLLGLPGVASAVPNAVRGDLMERRLGMRPYVATPMDRYMADPLNNEMPEITEVSPEFLRRFSNEIPVEEVM